MELFLSRYRTHTFLTMYVSVFMALAALGYYVVHKSSFVEGHPAQATHSFASDLAYYDMPRMTIVVGGGDVHMRIDMALEISKKDMQIVEGYQPRMTAKLNSFLSTLGSERVREAQMLPWLRAEMLAQVNSVGMPVPVHDLLFRQLVVM
jgi:flagellar basal body-associated protein FliL